MYVVVCILYIYIYGLYMFIYELYVEYSINFSPPGQPDGKADTLTGKLIHTYIHIINLIFSPPGQPDGTAMGGEREGDIYMSMYIYISVYNVQI